MYEITVKNGVTIPQLGLGVFRSQEGEETENAVHWALEAGYRHIDTARVYKNEKSVGKAIKESAVPREEIFLTTKLWTTDIRAGRTREAFEESLEALQTDYLDMYMIHWPVDGFEQAWGVLEELYEKGLIRVIAVSNFHPHHLEKLEKTAKIMPMVNQIESHPYLNNQAVIDVCKKKGIQAEAWSPLGGIAGNVLQDERLAVLAKKYGKTPAQIILRWHLQRGVIVIPKSVHRERIFLNMDVFHFELEKEDMLEIQGWNCNLRVGSNPDHFNF